MSAGFARDGTRGGGLYLMCRVAYVGACVRGRLLSLAAGSVGFWRVAYVGACVA